MEYVARIDQFHKTRNGYIVFTAIELLLVYVFGSIALDTANMFAYLATIILIFGTLQNFVKAVTYKQPVVKKKAHAKR